MSSKPVNNRLFFFIALILSAITALLYNLQPQKETLSPRTSLPMPVMTTPTTAATNIEPTSVAFRSTPASVPASAKPSKWQRIGEAFEDRQLRTMDPALGYAPSERLLQAVSEGIRKQSQLLQDPEKSAGIIAARWKERGPSNVGGRTRSLLVDASDPSGKKVWAGSVSGGLWRCDDITAPRTTWIPVNDYLPNLAVMDIVQHQQQHNLLFFCTGEFASVRGIGVFRSTDGGMTWSHLPTTTDFQYCYKMIIHPNGDVYVTTNRGVWRSSNNGDTWTRIVGSGVSGVGATTFFDIKFASDNHVYVSSNNTIYKSPSGNVGTWSAISNTPGGPPSNSGRIEFDVADSNPLIIYAANNVGGNVGGIYKTVNGGASWSTTAMPNALGMDNFARGQAWYDLDIVIHPSNPNRVIVGGIDLHATNNGGSSWTQISQWFGGGGIQYVHADQHRIIYDPSDSNIIYFTNDGGVYRTQNGNAPLGQLRIADRNDTYNTSQFYAGAIHPGEAVSFFLGGTQDNGSIALNAPGVAAGRSVLGGDGFFCHIDENEPNIQMVSLYYADYRLSLDGGQSFSGGAALDGNFLSASDYDSRSNILYSQTRAADFYRWNVTTGVTTPVDVPEYDLNVSAVSVDVNTPHRVYFGNFSNGRIYRIDNAHDTEMLSATLLTPLAGTISGIAVEDGNPEHLLATVSNYGLPSVFESFDGGISWINVEGDLPDMPVNFCIFNPDNNRQAMLATEAGVWTTQLLDGGSTQWFPPIPGRGSPFVRVDMLRLRRADKVVLAATHGRGMFSSDVFATPKARMTFDQVAYLDAPVPFLGTLSTNAESWHWAFGDGNTDTLENTTHTYQQIGTYPVALTINNELSTSGNIKILPDVNIAWNPDKPAYGGDFEGQTEQYGVYTISGSSFERGKSTINGKDGTKSGQQAYVVGMNEAFYQANTHTMLYLPNFDFSTQGIYEFSFWGKWRIHPGFDGFRVEYSTDRGQNWLVLGSEVQQGWYNQRNNNLDGAVFPNGTAYFSGNRTEWQKYVHNVSFLSGNPNVAFRFVFKSDGLGSHIGLAIDDVQINAYEGELRTQLTRFEGSYVSGATSVKLDWNTQPEYFCKQIIVERSINGRDFEQLATINATGGRTLELQSYTHTSLAQRNLYFYRLKIINEAPEIGYAYEFYSPVIVMQRNAPVAAVNRIFPSPATTFLGVTFNGLAEAPVQYDIFDAAGRLIQQGTVPAPGPYLHIDIQQPLATGMYVLRIKVGDKAFESYKFVGG
jgi:hypothetical protein